MSRKLILTPYHHGSVDATNDFVNNILFPNHNTQVDVMHIVLASVAMAGVDSIHSMMEIKNSNTTLISNVISNKSAEKWNMCSVKVRKVLENYKTPHLSKKHTEHIDRLSYLIVDLLFAVEINSGLLINSNLKNSFSNDLLPLELEMPMKVLYESIQTKNVLLPMVKLDINKKDVLKLFDVFKSKDFGNFKDAHLEIDHNSTLTNKTIKSIEKASKDLYKKNTTLFSLKENVIKALPISTKIIDLFFGKLPGILADYASNLLVDNLQKNKTIALYNYDSIIDQIVKKNLDLYLEKKMIDFKNNVRT